MHKWRINVLSNDFFCGVSMAPFNPAAANQYQSGCGFSGIYCSGGNTTVYAPSSGQGAACNPAVAKVPGNFITLTLDTAEKTLAFAYDGGAAEVTLREADLGAGPWTPTIIGGNLAGSFTLVRM